MTAVVNGPCALYKRLFSEEVTRFPVQPQRAHYKCISTIQVCLHGELAQVHLNLRTHGIV